MKTVAIIQARMGSTRLPGKVLKDLYGKTVLQHVIDRVKVALPDVVIATSDKPADDLIANKAVEYGAKVFRGSEDDVLARYYGAAMENKADLVVRVTSDCPLYDGELLKNMLNYYEGEDYLSNVIDRRFPRGLDTEIFKFSALEKAYNKAIEKHQREHVTPFINQQPELFKIRHYTTQPNLSKYRWTLDTKEDWEMISNIYGALYKGKIFSTADVVKYLEEHPEVVEINAHIEQKKV